MKTKHYFMGFHCRTSKWNKLTNPNAKVWNNPETPSAAEKSLHPRAAYSMRSKAVGSHYNQCIYDAKGKLITTPPSAGTVDLKKAGTMGHYHHDVRPVVVANAIDTGKGPNSLTGVLVGNVNMKIPPGKEVLSYYTVRPTWHANCPKY